MRAPHTAPSADLPRNFTVANVIKRFDARPVTVREAMESGRAYPLVKTGIVLQSKVHGGSR